VAAASTLIIGFYVLIAPCVPWPLTLAVSLLHAVGIFLYSWLLRTDVVDVHSRKRTQAPGDGLRWCGHCACYVTAGPRTKHCHECRKCVQGFDHHCVYLQSCVGAVNYRAFFALLLAPTDGTAVVFDACASRETVWRVAIVSTHALLSLACLVLVSGLFALHCYLVATRQTTYEMVVARRRRLREEKAKREARGEEPEPPGVMARVSKALSGLRTGASTRQLSSLALASPSKSSSASGTQPVQAASPALVSSQLGDEQRA